MNPRKANNNIIEDLKESEGDESPVADLKRMMIRKVNKLEEELKEKMGSNSKNIKKTWIKN
jgi:hypothetical protein